MLHRIRTPLPFQAFQSSTSARAPVIHLQRQPHSHRDSSRRPNAFRYRLQLTTRLVDGRPIKGANYLTTATASGSTIPTVLRRYDTAAHKKTQVVLIDAVAGVYMLQTCHKHHQNYSVTNYLHCSILYVLRCRHIMQQTREVENLRRETRPIRCNLRPRSPFSILPCWLIQCEITVVRAVTQ